MVVDAALLLLARIDSEPGELCQAVERDRNSDATRSMNSMRLFMAASCGIGPSRKDAITPPTPSASISAMASATRAGDP